jgi:protein-disulfide isomerase
VLATEPQVIETYVRPGKVKLVFRDVLNHGERSIRTSEAAACAARQDRFWEMHGLLFEKQSQVWATGNDGLVSLMLEYGKQLAGMDQAAYAKCLTERTPLERLRAGDAEQRKRGITSQPIFEIGTQRLVGAVSFQQMAARLDAALK